MCRGVISAMHPLGTICKNHTLDLDFHVMLKHIEILVVDKNTGEVLHRVRRTCQTDVKQDFEDFFYKLADGFCRLIKESADNTIMISNEDYKEPMQQFLY